MDEYERGYYDALKWVYEHTYGDNYKLQVKDKMREFIKKIITMKELPIEEKAKAYEEALKQIKECTPDENGFVTIYPQEIFPELKESEDERIREELKHYLEVRRCQTNDDEEYINCNHFLAWLEKQAEQKSIDNLTQQEAMDIAVAKCFEQGEQKPADKVEPKFKVGDWVVCEVTGSIYQIDCIEILNNHKCGYHLANDGYISSDEVNHYYLWTIQDAKDGDVLDANGAPFIYKKHDKDYVYFYCGINLAGEFIEANESDTWNNNNKVYPATKEQRDLLFQKMHEAEYEWDAEKKELIKIKQTPVIIIQKFKVGDKVYAIKTGFECTIESIDEETYYGDTTNFDIKDQDNWKLVEQNPAWSEENEELMKWSIINLTELKDRFGEEYGKVGDCIDWLKSLRPQNRWKPSEEQIMALESATENCAYSGYQDYLRELIEQLKKLK